jgi:hypothetical protein
LRDVFQKLNSYNGENLNLHLLTRGSDRKYGFLTTELEKEEIKDDLFNLIKDQLKGILEKEEYIEEIYCPVTKYSSSTIETIPVNDINSFEDIISGFKGDIDCYNSNDLENTRIWAYVVVLGDNDLIIFQKCQPSQVLETHKKFKLIENDGHFSKMNDTILTISPKMDCIVYNSKMFILNKFHYEEIFGIIDKFEEELTEKIRMIPQESVLVDLDELLNFCKNDRNKIKKLYKVLDSNGFAFLTKDNVEQLNQTHNLGINIENNMIKLTPNDTRKVLNLMDEDYMNSAISNKPFVSHFKSPIRINKS